jgi:putative membrane protein
MEDKLEQNVENTLLENNDVEQKFSKFIVIISIVIPLVVALLFGVKLKDLGYNVEPLSYLPPIYAGINGLTAIVLVCGVLAIKNGKRKLHERLMTAAISLSVIFLVMYVAYHMSAPATIFGDINHNGILDLSENINLGITRYFYLFLLISHIMLSVAIIPLVLITYVRALAEKFDRHRSLAKITFPIWLYVAVTGVIVYLMISPYYAN